MNGIILLEGLEFFAYHGVSEAERQTGNKYIVDIKIISDFEQAAASDSIRNTIDYQKLYLLVKAEIEKPTKLLETIAKRVSDKVHENFKVNAVEVSVSKLNPPIGGICTRAKVIYPASV
ncbi:MAG: dihydroneopterin aldolase [Cytophagales bacterium]|nr:dihydroneopterin aldolase [Cytophagales bacterium]